MSTKKVTRVTEEQIRARALEIYLATGNSDSMTNWLQAEAQLTKPRAKTVKKTY
jgi:hypothetical protein